MFYIFVNLNGTVSPDYYILKPEEIKPLIQEYEKTNRGVLQLGRVKNNDMWKGGWDRKGLSN